MAEQDFTCDRCGRTQPANKLKEVFVTEGGQEARKELCPVCLDEVMNAGDEVYGVEGDRKRAGAYVADDAADQPSRDVTGERGADQNLDPNEVAARRQSEQR